MRIVSLLPSLTEVCFMLGLDDQVVAVTHECDYPAVVRSLPRVTRSILSRNVQNSAGIDRQVRAAQAAGQSLYELEIETLTGVQPDLILTQDLCHVCAVSIDEVRAIASGIDPAPVVASIEPRTFDEIFASIIEVGEWTGRRVTAQAAVEGLRARLSLIADHVARGEHQQRVVCLEWLDPPMIAGHWVPEMVRLAGGVDPLGVAGEPSFPVTWHSVIDARPEVIVLMPCGYNLAETMADVRQLREGGNRLPESLAGVPAVADGHVYAVDGSSYFSRPGPRVVVGVEILTGILHAELASIHTPPGTVEPVSLIAGTRQRS